MFSLHTTIFCVAVGRPGNDNVRLVRLLKLKMFYSRKQSDAKSATFPRQCRRSILFVDLILRYIDDIRCIVLGSSGGGKQTLSLNIEIIRYTFLLNRRRKSLIVVDVVVGHAHAGDVVAPTVA